MSKGGFILHSFSVAGDNRSRSTDPVDSELGSWEVMSLKIISNCAALLCNAGWTVDESTNSGYGCHYGSTAITKTYYTVVSENKTSTIFVLQDTTNKLFEIPLVYEATGAKCSLFYSYYTYSGSVAGLRHGEFKSYTGSHFVDKNGTNNSTWWRPSGGTVGGDLIYLYTPPTGESFRLYMPLKIYTSSTYNVNGIAISNYNSTYNYNFITKGDTFSFILTQDTNVTYYSTRDSGTLFLGSFIFKFEKLFDENDTYSYGIMDTYLGGLTSSSEYVGGLGSQYISTSNNIFSLANPRSTIILSTADGSSSASSNKYLVPYLQFHDNEGNTIATVTKQSTGNNDPRHAHYWQSNCRGLFYDQNLLNRGKENLYKKGLINSMSYSKITLGTNLTLNSTDANDERWDEYYVNKTTHSQLKGIIDEDYMIRIPYYGQFTDCPTYKVGQTFNDGQYVYIGSGLLLGWDSSNPDLLANSTNTMYTPVIVETT